MRPHELVSQAFSRRVPCPRWWAGVSERRPYRRAGNLSLRIGGCPRRNIGIIAKALAFGKGGILKFSTRRDVSPLRKITSRPPNGRSWHYAHFRPPFNIFETAFPFPVSRYFCVGERGELGCVISTNPISSAGYNALLRRCARLENRIFVRIW